ncbi:MAG: DNA polymerase III subunit delta' C-terminal domain-containing protein [Gammaproteobacteria bacterium]|nr:DNA polymerase III subunit delta' C-terminal domain-containing protein [Gammaproteobacteria bacterium]
MKGERIDADRAQLELLLSIGSGAPLSAVLEFDDDYLERRQQAAGAIDQVVRGANPLEAARPFARGDAVTDLAIIYSLFADALRLALTDDENLIKNRDMGEILRTVTARIPGAGLVRCVDAIARDRRAAAGPSNPNVPLLFEALFIEIASESAL